MILLAALAAGLLAGVGLSLGRGQPYRVPALRHMWVAALAFLPQALAFYMPARGFRTSDALSAAVLVGSQGVFLAFVWLNRRLVGLTVLGAGLLLNLLVIGVNGGFMPISPDTVSELVSANESTFRTGDRFSVKDRIQATEDTRLPWLSDRYLTPPWMPYRVAFSVGDVLVAIGVFLLLALPQLTLTSMPRRMAAASLS